MKRFFCYGKQSICESQECNTCQFYNDKGGEWIDVPDVDLNPYWKRICKLADKQRAKGMETYGQGLESNPADMLKRIEHLQEELIDGLMYCEWIKDKVMEGELHD